MEKEAILKNEKINKLLNYDISKKIISFFQKENVMYILFLYFIAFCLFAYTLINNMFTIPLGGDFVLQEIPFYYNGYDDWWTFLTSGKFVFWDENTNLGVNNIGANSFYYLLNIFFLPTLLVPRSLVPQMQAFLIITKLVLAGYVMKRLLKDHFKVSKETSELMGLAYAFCGWNLYYLWFNHFLEISVVFPFVIYGIEVVLKDKKPSILMLSLLLSAVTNYFFFIMICFTSVIYAGFRYFQLFPKMGKKDRINIIGVGFSSYVVALTMSLIVLLPTFSVAMQSSRADSSSYLTSFLRSFDALVVSLKTFDFNLIMNSFQVLINSLFKFSNGAYGSTTNVSNITRVYLYPLMSFFYPTVSCNSHLLIKNNGYDNALSSLFVYTPVMFMLLPSIINSIRERKISHLIGVGGMLFLIFTPFAYYVFSGVTNVCYGRWQLFPVICMIIYIAINFDKMKNFKNWYFDLSLIFCLGMEIFLIVKGKALQNTPGVGTIDPDAFNVCYIQMAYLVCLYLYFRWKRKDSDFLNNIKWTIAFETMVSFNLVLGFTISIGNQNLYVGFFGTTKYQNLYGGKESVDLETSLINQIKKEDDSFYRIYNTSMIRSSNNLGMVEGYNGLGTFHSIYNYEIDDFASWTHFTYNGSWSMGEHEKKINMDAFLNVKYFMTNKEDKNVPFGFSKYLEEQDKIVYINDDYVPLGFNFDQIVSAEKVSSTLNSTKYSSYYLYNNYYTAYVPKLEYLLTSSAILYGEDIDEILTEYKDLTSIYHSNLVFSNDFNGKIYTTSLSNDEVTIEKAIWDDGPGGTGDYVGREEKVPYSTKDATGLKWNSLITCNLTTPIGMNATESNPVYLTVVARMGENLVITLKDKNGEIICSDSHMYNAYDKSADTKYERGFYSNRPVYTIEILVKDTFKSNAILAKPNISYQYYSTYKENMDKLKEVQFTNVVKDVNSYSFDSTLDKNMIAVLSIPYDDGWKLIRTDSQGEQEEVKIYKGQGGFVSFVNEKGDYHYELSYYTPYLYEGSIGFIIGSALFAGLYYSLEILKKDHSYYQKLMSFE